MPSRKSSAVLNPALGLDLGNPPIQIKLGALRDGNNFRVAGGKLTNEKCGWVSSGLPKLNGPVLLIETFTNRAGVSKTVMATYTDLYQVTGLTTVAYLTPRYATGTVDVSAADPAVVTGTGTAFQAGTPVNAKAGDQIHFGSAVQTSITATWYTIASVDSPTQLTLTTAVTGAPLAGQAYTIRRLFTGDDSDIWDGEMWIDTGAATDYAYFTNGKDTIVRWDLSASTVVYSAIGVVAKVLKAYSNMMIYSNVIESGNTLPSDIVASDIGDPETQQAQFKVHGGWEGILATLPIGDNLVIYSGPDPGNAVLAQFIGGDEVFAFRKAISGTGPFAQRVVADMGDYHEFLGGDTGYRFDGASLAETGNVVWKGTIGGRDPTRQHLAFHLIVEEQGETLWAVPMPSDTTMSPVSPPARAFSEHYLEAGANPGDPAPFGRRDFPFLSGGFIANVATVSWDTVVGSWDENANAWNDSSLLSAFPKAIVGDEDGDTYFIYQSNTANGAHLPSFIHFGRRATMDAVLRGLIARVYPFVKDPTGAGPDLDVVLHLADSAHGEALATDPFPIALTLEDGAFFVSPYRRGRFAEIEFQMNQTGGVYECVGYDWQIKDGAIR